ncbi:MAG TPA: TetR family transcriptional regulator [Coleofasciculaceae cyanobacterium]|jgi:hypothetical protein
MTNVPLSNILLPAVFISSAVFSALTLPFALIKSESVVVELPPIFNSEDQPIEIQPIFNGEHKEIAIPYVGFAIVVSVGAGIASVEVNRRWQAYRESAMLQEQLPNVQPTSLEKQGQREALERPDYRPEASTIDRPLQNEIFRSQSQHAPNTMTEAQDVVVDAPEQVVNFTQLGLPQPTIPHQTIELSATLEKLNSSQVPQENQLIWESSRVSSQPAAQDSDLAFSKILESRTLYQTCRIKVPHLERRLLAILVDEQYYSFFRSEKTKEKALETIAKLGHRTQKTVITKTEKSYVVWALEPEVSSKISS